MIVIVKWQTASSCQIISITLFFCNCLALLCLSQASSNCTKMPGQSHFRRPNFSSSNFNVQGHILSTAHGHIHFTYCTYSCVYISIYTTKSYHMPKQLNFWHVNAKILFFNVHEHKKSKILMIISCKVCRQE